MNKATAIAPANIAFIKYWGRKNASLRLPCNTSISMNLSASTTTTTVEFSEREKDEIVLLEEGGFSDAEVIRVVRQLDVIREYVGTTLRARVASKNTFPKSTGAASSASGFAALTVAALAALGQHISEKECTILARLGSGSACRSIPDGFVRWEVGVRSEDSFARSLYPASYWDLRDILVVVEQRGKDVSSSRGHDMVETSPLFADRLKAIPGRIARVEEGLASRNLSLLGNAIEEECLNMHHVMQTQTPALYYWTDRTITLMDIVPHWRREGIPVYFTIDAGPNVHLICEEKDEQRVLKRLKELSGIEQVIVNKSAPGARLVDTHLF